MNTLRLLDTGHLTAAENMALDRIILDEVANGLSRPTLRFLQFSPPAALVGYHQDVRLEVRQDYCAERGIDINRRLTGGGALYFQESGLGWELFGIQGEAPFVGSYETILFRICEAAASALSAFGVEARFRPRNDIEVNGRKISGTGGATESRGFMFQGTLLVKNEVELFLKALRVPVEKLKKREIESLMERICFLSDIVDPLPSSQKIKAAMARAFEERLGVGFEEQGLTGRERSRLESEKGFYSSEKWIMRRNRPPDEGDPVRSITQTDAGAMRAHLWTSPGGKRIRQALIAGDFFAIPTRLVNDLEAALVGLPTSRTIVENAVLDFFQDYDGRMIGIDPLSVAAAVGKAAERVSLLEGIFSRSEANELFFVNVEPREIFRHHPRWLLLPYCSKDLDCEYRNVPGCSECGLCSIGDCVELAKSLNMQPITVQSFEHLMEALQSHCADRDGLYVGSCCEAFYAKHQKEMEAVRAKGLLINLDSTTCYDLGKGTLAYKGYFDNQTTLNFDLIEKTLRRLHENTQ